MPLRSFGEADEEEMVDEVEEDGDLGDEVNEAGEGGVCSNTGRVAFNVKSSFSSSSLLAIFLEKRNL